MNNVAFLFVFLISIQLLLMTSYKSNLKYKHRNNEATLCSNAKTELLRHLTMVTELLVYISPLDVVQVSTSTKTSPIRRAG